jgi:quercetin dioxygenase-like cupin family protein
MANAARHEVDPDVIGMPLEEISSKYLARFKERPANWKAYADAAFEGWRRARYQFIGNTNGGTETGVIPQGGFTLCIMEVPPGQGNAAHTHEIEEVFFVLEGQLTVFFETPEGERIEKLLDRWDCVSCPKGVIHGYQNNSSETVFMQVMLGKRGKTELLGYADEKLFEGRGAHLNQT